MPFRIVTTLDVIVSLRPCWGIKPDDGEFSKHTFLINSNKYIPGFSFSGDVFIGDLIDALRKYGRKDDERWLKDKIGCILSRYSVSEENLDATLLLRRLIDGVDSLGDQEADFRISTEYIKVGTSSYYKGDNIMERRYYVTIE